MWAVVSSIDKQLWKTRFSNPVGFDLSCTEYTDGFAQETKDIEETRRLVQHNEAKWNVLWFSARPPECSALYFIHVIEEHGRSWGQ